MSWRLLLVLATLLGAAVPAAALPPQPVLRGWVEGFKSSERGPFELIKWFCNDGSVRPARAGCGGEGRGVQHGDWNEQARALRQGGYRIANVLVALDPAEFTGPNADLDAWRQLLIERFLIGYDDGWIFRGAYGYRGAFQIEDEEKAARRIVLAMLGDPRWRDPARYLLLRESVRLLPLAVDESSAAGVRARAMGLAERDRGFMSLRAKIHSFPDGGDAQRVRDYAAERGGGMASEYESLAEQIEALYAPQGAAQAVLELAPLVGDEEIAQQLRDKSAEFQAEVNPGRRLAAAAKLMRLLRDSFPTTHDPQVALVSLMTSLALEREAYASGAEALPKVANSSTRRSRLWLLAYDAEAAYGSGFISARELAEIDAAVKSIESQNPTVREYREVVHYLARVPEWSGRWLEFNFGPATEQLAGIEPLARHYSADRLRGSPLLFYSGVLDTLQLDGNELAGVQHEMFGERVGGGLRALNPGLARGPLRTAMNEAHGATFDPDGIYLLPETTAELTPVSGILTRGEGSSLSHIQLLARNLGIPNVVVQDALASRLEARLDQRGVLAVSPGGVVQLEADGPQWDAIFGAASQEPPDVLIQPDLVKLDLGVTEPIPLSRLRATDSGRVCGPKGANLGELRFAFGSAVPDGVVIPFGAFRRFLDQPFEPGGPSAFEWMQRRYDEIQAASYDRTRQQRMASEMLARLRQWIATAPFPKGFETDLEWALRELFGREGYGVFVRSDTNVEDLPGFTGAGLNQTVPNVVGFENVLKAVRTVWASPFSDRSYAWRQAHMTDPENVFPAVVVQQAFPSEKSGVLVTVDVDTGDPGWLSVAVNEGVAGAVDGQAAESLRIDTRSGVVRLLAPATTPLRAVLLPNGGVKKVAASGAEAVLSSSEIRQLAQLARDVPLKLASMRTADGRPIPADIEFAFRDGRLALLQIRPLNESKRARRSVYLAQLDAPLRERGEKQIWIGGVPGRVDPAEEAARKAEEARQAAEEEALRKAAEKRRLKRLRGPK